MVTCNTDRRFGPRPQTSEAVLWASIEILIDEGAHALTPLRLHQVTGVARTTIYRHWPTRASIVQLIIDFATRRSHEELMTGDVEHDLIVTTNIVIERTAIRPIRQMYAALVEYAPDADENIVIPEEFMQRLTLPTQEVIQSGLDRGILEGLDAADLASELLGPVFHRYLLLAQTPTPDAGQKAVRNFLARYR